MGEPDFAAVRWLSSTDKDYALAWGVPLTPSIQSQSATASAGEIS